MTLDRKEKGIRKSDFVNISFFLKLVKIGFWPFIFSIGISDRHIFQIHGIKHKFVDLIQELYAKRKFCLDKNFGQKNVTKILLLNN